MLSFLHNYFPYGGGVAAPIDDPPRRSWSTLNSIIGQSQPNPRLPGPFPYDQQRRKLPPSISAVQVDNAPIKIAAATLALITAIWATPAPAAPQQKRPSIVPSLVAAVVEQTPYSSEVSLSAILQSWRAIDRAPQQARKLPPQLLSVDDPPFGESRQIPQQPPAWWPPQSAPRTQPVSVDDPPRMVRAMPPAAWFAQAAQPTLRLSYVVQEALAAADFVPFTRQPLWRATVEWPVASRRQLPPSLIAVAEDNPPFGLRPEIIWPVPTWTAQVAARIAPLIASAVAADNPPFGLKPRYWDYPPPSWRAQSGRRAIVASTDDPPFGARRQPFVTWSQSWPAQSPPRLVQAAPAAEFVPFARQPNWLARFALDWPTQRRLLPPSLLAVPEDDPPFGLRAQIAWAAPAIEQPRAPRKIAAIAVEVVFVIGEPSGTWRAPVRSLWFAPLGGTVWKAPGQERVWRAGGGRVWKAMTREGWRR